MGHMGHMGRMGHMGHMGPTCSRHSRPLQRHSRAVQSSDPLASCMGAHAGALVSVSDGWAAKRTLPASLPSPAAPLL